MIKKIIILGVAIAVCLWVGKYIQSYNHNHTMNVQQRFQDTMNQVDDRAKELLKEADEQKKKVIKTLQDKKDSVLQQQQKELFN